MKVTIYPIKNIQFVGFIIFIILMVNIMIIPQAFSHGGKTHDENEFTAFSALNEATKLYGKLLEDGKLQETWEIELVNIKISNREKNGDKEFVVSFEKTSGDPAKVFIFIDANGNYSGSNFSGE